MEDPDDTLDQDDRDQGDRKRAELARIGTDTAAGVGGAAAGLGGTALFPPWGALLGPAVSVALKKLFTRLGVDRVFDDARDEFIERHLGPREAQRVGVAYEAAINEIRRRLENGEELRDDGFFPGEDGTKSSAEDALEGVLLKAQGAYESRKAEHLGELWAWLGFHPEIGRAHANLLIELAGRLTYTQLILLGIFGIEDRSGLPDWESTGMFTPAEMGLVAAIEELGREELLLRDDNRAIATFSDVNPRQMKTSLNGRLLREAMGLDRIEREDFEEVRDLLMKLGKIEVAPGEKVHLQVDAVVPRGKPADTTRVQMSHQVIERVQPTLGLADFADKPD